jgi:hypothetical protein
MRVRGCGRGGCAGSMGRGSYSWGRAAASGARGGGGPNPQTPRESERTPGRRVALPEPGPKRKRPAECRAEPKGQHEAPAAVGALWRAQARAMPRAARACGTLRMQQRHLGWLCMRYSSQRSCEIVTLSRLLCNLTVGMESGRVDLVMLQSASSGAAWSWPAATCSAMPVRRAAGRVRALRMHRWRRALRGPARLAGARSMRRSSYHLVAKS